MSSGSSRLAPIPLRLALGAVLCYHGYLILYKGEPNPFHTIDLPNRDIIAQIAAWGQLAGGGMILVGLLTRLAALLNAGAFFVMIWKLKLGTDILAGLKNLPSYEFWLLILAGCWALVLMGGGALSADGMFGGGGGSRSAPPAKA